VFFNVVVRGFVMRDADADALAFDPELPGAWAPRISRLSAITGSSRPDLSRFSRHGGKLILVHGNDDALVPVGWSEAYYRSVVRTMGAATVDGFVRFYAVPDKPVATDVGPKTRGRTRPICRYPTWPRYKGSGDINSAASYGCATP
jgi:feruloyl esterase